MITNGPALKGFSKGPSSIGTQIARDVTWKLPLRDDACISVCTCDFTPN
jgi:hypothetical protein